MDINVIRALSGDYKSIIINKKEVKCHGYKDIDLSLESFLDIGLVDKDKIILEIIFDFLRTDVSLAENFKDSNVVLTRKDGKTLVLDKSTLKDQEILKVINFSLIRSIYNILNSPSNLFQIYLSEDKIVCKSTSGYKDTYSFVCNQPKLIDFSSLTNLLLQEVRKNKDVSIHYKSNGCIYDYVVFNIMNKEIKITGELDFLMPLVKRVADYKETLTKNTGRQLKMKGF